ncbi:MAG: GntR family transcriptional regulator [Breznakibacter sp.]
MTRKIVQISNSSRQAKYRQIINSILNAVATGRLSRGDKVPSINDIANEFGLSRDTVMLAFNELKARGVIMSVPGIGYFIESTNVQFDQKIFLLFDEFSSFKEILYNSFISALEGKGQVDIYFHHFNLSVFEALIKDNAARYTTYVILPGNLQNIGNTINVLPQDKIIILDQLSDETKGKYSAVYQSFQDDIYHCLETGLEKLRKYNKFILAYPGGKEPIGFVEGFQKFCCNFGLDFDVVPYLTDPLINKGEAYIMPKDSDLVTVVKKAQHEGWQLGKDIGVISINETPLKEVVANGITTISTDFDLMGKTLAKMVLENIRQEIKNPARLIVRGSL